MSRFFLVARRRTGPADDRALLFVLAGLIVRPAPFTKCKVFIVPATTWINFDARKKIDSPEVKDLIK